MIQNGMDTLNKAIKQKLVYDPESGSIVNRTSGLPAKARDRYGYVEVRLNVNGKMFYLRAHRVAWFLTHGIWPKRHLDHINGIKDDNRLINLRDVSPNTNMTNLKRNREGDQIVGGFFDKVRNKWKSHINHNTKRIHLGYFNTKEECLAAYLGAKKALGL